MLKDYSGPVISLTVRDLLRYTLTQSDNNASNLMFKDMVNVAQTDSFIATLIPRSSFQIAYTEEEMSADHNKAYSNYTSPLGAAMSANRHVIWLLSYDAGVRCYKGYHWTPHSPPPSGNPPVP